MRKVLVTGGAGFIASHLVDALVERGLQVRVLDNLSTGRLENLEQSRNKIDFLEADLTDPVAVARAVSGMDCIFHQAAIASVPRSVAKPLETHAACATATLTLLDAARKAGVRRVVYAGSSSAYGNSPKPSKQETDLPMAISPYAAAKLAGELYCQSFAAVSEVETVALRYFNVFGPRQDPNSEYSAVIPKFITTMLAGKAPTIFGDGKQSRDFVFVADVVQANLLAAETDVKEVSGHVFNVGSSSRVTLLDLIAQLNELLGTHIKPKLEKERTGDVRESLADISQAQKHLGYEPKVDFEEGLSRSIEYYRSLVKKPAAKAAVGKAVVSK
ncbi:MAG TPA: SDR family oxidoreductase [Pirellulales bacterium]|jgi:UDP-glucose 4-epimerase|nr:SDR family oxidoreductase [Pirellulales bacterium]